MSIASKLTKLETDITSAYNAIGNKSGTLPTYKNTENLSTSIDSIVDIQDYTYSQENEIVSRFLNEVNYTGNATGTITLTETIQNASSSDTSVATITHSGMVASVTGISAGTSTLTLTTDNNSYSIIVNVTSISSQIYISLIDSYASTTTSYSKCKPAGLTLTTGSGTLSLADNYTKIVTSYSVSSGNNTIKNVSPNSGEYVINNNNVVEQGGVLKPTGFLRMIDTNAPNVRDLGGWTCDGGTIKYGKLFRGAEITTNDKTVLVGQCGVKCELNLRGKTEAGRDYSVLGDDIEYVCPTRYVWHTLTDKETWKEILTCIFENIKYNRSVFFHCAGGADRTGTVASIIEAILGVTRYDMEKDYELTCMYTGVSTSATARRRNEQDWVGEINQIEALPVGNTFRDKVLNWVASMGFTEDEINEFRSNMIDGTPDTINLNLDTYTITKTATNITFDNNINSVDEYQGYEVSLNANLGYVISNVEVTMGGTTYNAFSGTKTNLYRRITNTLTNCITNNYKYNAINGQSYGASITANSGYTLTGATVLITEGGIDMTNEYYSDGKIIIPQVTGDIAITVTAVSQGPAYTNIWETPYKVNSRLNSSENDPIQNGSFISAWYPVTQAQLSGESIILRSNKDIFNYNGLSGGGDYIRFYPSTTAGSNIASTSLTGSHTVKAYDSQTGIYSLTIKDTTWSSQTVNINYFRWCAQVSTTALTSDWFDGCILTINEEIV